MQRPPRRLSPLLPLVLVLPFAIAATSAEDAAWPQYQGPDGNFRPAPAVGPLVDDPSFVRMRWNGPHNLGVGKTGSQHLKYNYEAMARKHGLAGKDDLIPVMEADDLELTPGALTGRIRAPIGAGHSDGNAIALTLERTGGDAPWTGTWRRTIPAYDRPVAVADSATLTRTTTADGSTRFDITLAHAIARRDQLDDPDTRRTTTITLLGQDGTWHAGHARANRLNTTDHEVGVDRWQTEDGRIRATLTVIYHDDIHYHHNPDTKGPTAARYELDLARQADGSYTGRHSGTVGIAWSRSGSLDP